MLSLGKPTITAVIEDLAGNLEQYIRMECNIFFMVLLSWKDAVPPNKNRMKCRSLAGRQQGTLAVRWNREEGKFHVIRSSN
jgi:hypothetical protein